MNKSCKTTFPLDWSLRELLDDLSDLQLTGFSFGVYFFVNSVHFSALD